MTKQENGKMRLRWGHININVSNLESSIEFYEKLGFEIYKPSIPYTGLTVDPQSKSMDEGSRTAFGLPEGTSGRACIMQLGNGYPKLDLTQLDHMTQSIPLSNADLGLVRICLASANLQADYDNLKKIGIEFISPPQTAQDGRAEIAICIDPDGTLVELIQVQLGK